MRNFALKRQLMPNQEKTLWQVVKGYFNALPDKENENETIRQIHSGVTFHGANLWVLIFAILIASLGLNVNSTAVIIGAMLISPLMGPIIGMGLAVGISDLDLLKRSATHYLVATVISVITATLYFLITPLTEAQSELLARTSPTLYDVLIALFGGAAGILALCTKGKGNVIPGVAIATALMPPLCTAGYGLAVGNASYFFGAFYLFFINTVFIALATFLGVRMLRFKRKAAVDATRLAVVNRYIIGAVVLTMLPAAYMTVQIVKASVQENAILKFVKSEFEAKGAQIISHKVDSKTNALNIVTVGKRLTNNEIEQARKAMNEYKLDAFKLNVIQGTQTDSLMLSQMLSLNGSATQAKNTQLLEQADQIQTLKAKTEHYERLPRLANDMRKEIQAVCPQARSISLANVAEARVDTTGTAQYVLAVVDCKGKLSAADKKRLHQWLRARLKVDSLRLLVE